MFRCIRSRTSAGFAGLLLGRPYGPESTHIGRFEDTMPNHTELHMATSKWTPGRPEFKALRAQYDRPETQKWIRSIPRDLGQIPRDYIIRLLYFNQPCTTDTLWTLAKADDACPLDSKRHMKMVMKIATLQNWIIFEKNQTNNLYYATVHPNKSKEAQDLLYQHRRKMELAETESAKKVDEVKKQVKTKRSEGLDMAITQLQHQLITCVVKLQEHNPALIKELPCVTESGGINFHWYDNQRRIAKQQQEEEEVSGEEEAKQ